MTCTFMSGCNSPVSMRVEWGLLEMNGQPRKIPFNKAMMCQECYRKLKQTCIKAVEDGRMHWKIEAISPAILHEKSCATT